MKLRTEYAPTPAPWQIAPTNPVGAVGSCFAGCAAHHLQAARFEAWLNPFGTVFGPTAVARQWAFVTGDAPPDPAGLVCHEGTWYHYDFHSDCGADTPEALAALLNARRAAAHAQLQRTDVLLLTWGTAWVHRRRDTDALVANCHRQPAALFEREVLSPTAVVDAARELLATLRRVRPALRVVLTVSPVRHTRDTLPGNSLSKAALRWAAYEVAATDPLVSYFPSYEIMVDDLRDYRFYGPDLIRPTPTAEAYIWEQFQQTYFSEETRTLLRRWERVRQRLAHRPRRVGTAAHRRFLADTLAALRELQGALDVRSAIADVEAQLAAFP